MKRLLLASVIVLMIVVPGLVFVVNAGKPDIQRPDDLYFVHVVALHATPTQHGPDDFGYDYANHTFDGYLANLYLGALGLEPFTGDTHAYEMAHPTIVRAWFWQHHDVRVTLSWSEAFLSTADADGDSWLDRHAGAKSYVGSGAWATAQLDGDGWSYHARLIAAPDGAVESSGAWRTENGTVIGASVWDGFAATQIATSGEGAGPAGSALLAHMP